MSYPPPGHGYGPPPPYRVQDHPKATTALVLGIVAVGGGVMCYLPLVLGPFAWVIGRQTTQEIDAAQGRLGGRGMAQAGMVLGIVGTALLCLAAVALFLYLGFFAVVTLAAAVPLSGSVSGNVSGSMWGTAPVTPL